MAVKGESFDAGRSSSRETGAKSFRAPSPDSAPPPFMRIVSPDRVAGSPIPQRPRRKNVSPMTIGGEQHEIHASVPPEQVPNPPTRELSDREKDVLAVLKENSGLTETEIAAKLGYADVGPLKPLMPRLKREGHVSAEKEYDPVTRTFTRKHSIPDPLSANQKES